MFTAKNAQNSFFGNAFLSASLNAKLKACVGK